MSVHFHAPDATELSERVEFLESRLSAGQQQHEKSFTLTEAFIQRTLSEQEEYREQLEAKYELLHEKYEFLEKKHDSFISDQNAKIRQEESVSLQLKDNYALLQKQLQDTRNWTDSIITFWMTISGLLATIFGIGIPLITQRKYESKLQNMVSKEIEFLDLKARSMITDNKTEKMKFYDRMIEMQPSSFQVYTMRADLFLELDSYHEAIRDYKRAVELVEQDLKSPMPKSTHKDLSCIYYQLGKAASRYSKYNEAADFYDLALELTPKDPQALLGRGHNFYNIGEKEKALSFYSSARRHAKYGDYIYCMCSGYEAIESDMHEKAVELFSKAIDLSPKSAAAWQGRAVAYSELKDFDSALADYKKSIKMDPRCPASYNGRGNMYYSQAKYEDALADYNKAIELNSAAASYYNRGILYHRLDKNEDALADYNKAIELNSQCVEAYNDRGNLYYSQAKYEDALSDYNKAIELNSENETSYCCRGNLYHRLDENEDALADYNKAIELKPSYIIALKNRAILHEVMESFEAAIKDYQTILSINSDDEKASTELKRLQQIVSEKVVSNSEERENEIVELLSESSDKPS